MAADFIVVDRTDQHGNSTVRLANLLRETQDLAADLLANAGHMWDTGPDYTQLESLFGLSAGSGGNFLTLLTNVDTALGDSSLTEFVARVAGQ